MVSLFLIAETKIAVKLQEKFDCFALISVPPFVVTGGSCRNFCLLNLNDSSD